MKKRLDKLRKIIEDYDLDAILVSKSENYLYFSGFNGSYAYLLITKESQFLFTDFRYIEQALLQAPNFELIKVNNNFLEFLKDKISELDINKVGFESLVSTYNFYSEMNDYLKGVQLVPINSEIDNIRSVKDKDEIVKIEKAIEIADLTFSHILDYIRPNVSEKDIALEMEYFMKKNGASALSFETIVASGYRGSMPHGKASEKLIESGDTIVLDFGAIYEGYCSDMTRTVFLGNPKDEMLKIYNIVLNAQNEAIQSIKEGLTGIEVDLNARRIIINEGYEENFGHGLGHGVGLEIHESPRLSQTGKNILTKNMTVTIEPGIYISGVGGVRIEDIVLIGDKKSKVLTKSSKEIIIL